MSVNITKLAKGVEGLFIKNNRFNTTLITFNFYLPLKKDKVAENALLPFVLTSCCNRYPDFSRLNYKLSKLYGARLSASAEKVGDFQLLKMGISVINDKYALDNEPLCAQGCELLTRLIFEPKVDNNAFFDEDVEREKRKAIEHIKGEISEKRTYARKRLIEEMYRGKPYGISKCGTEEQVAAVTANSLYNAWQRMLKTAYVRINVVSGVMPEGLFEGISAKFQGIDRENVTDCSNVTATRKVNTVKVVTENMDIAQGKLVMGFSSAVHGKDKDTLPLLVMCDIFGGGPYSRLFTNVREKLSLCYYCSANAVRVKGLLMVDSGVEASNADKAYTEILNQLEEMKNDNFSDFEFESSKKSITDSLLSYNDSQNALDTWYSVKIYEDNILTPEETAKKVLEIKRSDIVRAAKGVNLHTVYKLMPKEAK